MTEAKVILFWLAALITAALIEPVKHRTEIIKMEDLDIEPIQMEMVDEMEKLNARLDSLEQKIEADSCALYHPNLKI